VEVQYASAGAFSAYFLARAGLSVSFLEFLPTVDVLSRLGFVRGTFAVISVTR
jgi:hypothetical protein